VSSFETISAAQTEQIIQLHRQLVQSAMEKVDEARQELFRVGYAICGERMDAFQKGERGLEDIPLSELADAIIESVHQQADGRELQQAPGKTPEHWSRELETLRQQVDIEAKRANELEENNRWLQKKVAVMEQTLQSERLSKRRLQDELVQSQQPEPPLDYQDWFQKWQADRTFDQEKSILLLHGETGVARVSELQQVAGERLGMSASSAYRHILSCVQQGVMEKQSSVSTAGRPAELVILSARGRWAYNQMTGKAPVSGEYEDLLKAHKSDRQAALVLEAQALFRRLGYEVEESTTIKIDVKRTFQPDLIAHKDGLTYYLEIETGEKVDRPSLIRKWENAMAAGGGRIFLVAAKASVMTNLVSNINRWSESTGQRPHIFATHLAALRKLQPGEDPWVRKRGWQVEEKPERI